MTKKMRYLCIALFASILAIFVSACDSLPFINSNKSAPPTTLPMPTIPSGTLSADQIFNLSTERVELLNSYSFSEIVRFEIPEIGYRFSSSSAGAASADKGVHKKMTDFIFQNGITETQRLEMLMIFNPPNVFERIVEGADWELSERKISFGLVDILDMKGKATNINLVGEEKLNDVIPCYHLSFDLPPEYLAETSGWTVTSPTIRTDMWISKEELLIRSFIQDFSANVDGYEIPKVTITENFFSFNRDVVIPSQSAP